MSESAVRVDSKSKWIILELIHKAFSRTSGLSIGERVRRSATILMDMTNARWSLRKCDSVGSGARVKGRMRVENRGSMAIGDRLFLVSNWVPTELLTGERGRIEVGQAAWINFGAVIAADDRVTIGDRVMIGQHCIISDADFFPDMPSAGVPPSA